MEQERCGTPKVSQQDPTTRVIAGTTADSVLSNKASSLPSPDKSEGPEPAVHHAQYGAEIHTQDSCPVKCKGRSHLARGQGLRAWALGSGLWSQAGQVWIFVLLPSSSVNGGKFLHL